MISKYKFLGLINGYQSVFYLLMVGKMILQTNYSITNRSWLYECVKFGSSIFGMRVESSRMCMMVPSLNITLVSF